MKKLFLFIVTLILVFFFVGCKDKVEYTLSLEAEATTIKVGEKTLIYADTNVLNAQFNWKSSDDKIATVNDAGLVTGVSVGTVTITCTVGELSKSIEITVIEKDMTSTEAKTLLTNTLNAYLNSNSGSFKVTVDDMVSEFVYNYTDAGLIESYMAKIYIKNQTNSERHVYVKEGYAYNLVNGTKTKKALTEQEIQTIFAEYSQEKFLNDATKFYNEEAFYNALEFVSRDKGLVTFKLNLSKYSGEVFETVGVNEIKLMLTLQDEKLVKVEVEKTVGLTKNVLTVEYFGTTKQTINYPTDLDSYGE